MAALSLKALKNAGARRPKMAFLAGLLPSILGAVGGGGGGGMLGAVAKRVGLPTARKRRRSRRRLTATELQELAQIKSILGKTAAANALPFYMGRGR